MVFSTSVLVWSALFAAAPEPASKVVFVCELGSAKSVLAAALFNRRAEERGLDIRATSRATNPDSAPVKPVVKSKLEAEQLPVPTEVPKRLEKADFASARVIVLGDLPPALRTLGSYETWEIAPVTLEYEKARLALNERIEQLLTALASPPRSK